MFTQANDTPLHTSDCGYYFISEAAREEFIANAFRSELGVEVEFVN